MHPFIALISELRGGAGRGHFRQQHYRRFRGESLLDITTAVPGNAWKNKAFLIYYESNVYVNWHGEILCSRAYTVYQPRAHQRTGGVLM